MKLTFQQREELKALSKELFRSSSRWQKVVERSRKAGDPPVDFVYAKEYILNLKAKQQELLDKMKSKDVDSNQKFDLNGSNQP